MKWIISNLVVIHLELRSNWLHFDDQRLEIKVTVNTKKCGLVVVNVRLQEHLLYGYICYYVIIVCLEHTNTLLFIVQVFKHELWQNVTKGQFHSDIICLTRTHFISEIEKKGNGDHTLHVRHFLTPLPRVTSLPPPLTSLLRKTAMQVIK